MIDFILAALPWVVSGTTIAVALVNFNKKKDKFNIEREGSLEEKNSKSTMHEDEYMAVGMCLGICIGSAFGSLGIVSLSYGISFGMLIGMVAGMHTKKKVNCNL